MLDEYLQRKKFSQFSNFFRYELLAKRPGVCWVDTDMYCLKPVEPAPYICGWEDGRRINGAILALPSQSRLLTALRNMFHDPNFVAPWLPHSERILYRLASAAGRPVSRARYPWGSLGPRALTWYIHEQQLVERVQPRERFYPVHYREVGRFFDKAAEWSPASLGGAHTVHIWNNMLQAHPDFAAPPAGSFLWKLRNGIPVDARGTIADSLARV